MARVRNTAHERSASDGRPNLNRRDERWVGWIVLSAVVVLAAAGYFSRPKEAAMRAGAEAALRVSQRATESSRAITLGDRLYSDYYIASKYTVVLSNEAVMICWGVFAQVQCSREPRVAA